MRFSFQQLFYILAFIFGLFAVMVFAKVVLLPLGMALLISFILLPVVKRLENWGINKMIAAFIPLLIMFMVIGGIITLFSNEIIHLSHRLTDFSEKLMSTFSDSVLYINKNVNFIENISKEELIVKGRKWFAESSGILLKNTFSGTASFVAGIVTTTIFAFLLLLYRVGLTKAFVAFGDEENKDQIFAMLKNVQCVGKKYLSGTFLLILILGVANSLGLLIIGIDNPFLFGFLAAILAIIPYIGTMLGALIPILYAFITSDSLWVPFAVFMMFWVIQIVESNFLGPKVVGGSLNVNALVAILCLLIGASVWGIVGMILFLPFAAMLKVVCEEFDQLRPIAMLISNDISNGKNTSKWVSKIKEKLKKR